MQNGADILRHRPTPVTVAFCRRYPGIIGFHSVAQELVQLGNDARHGLPVAFEGVAVLDRG